MDALKDVLHATRLKPQLPQQRRLTVPWHLEFSAANAAAFHLIESGCCYLHIPSQHKTISLTAGDLIVVSNISSYQLDYNPNAVSYSTLSEGHNQNSGTHPITTLVSGEFRSEQTVVYPIFTLLPPLILIPNDNGQPIYWLATALRGIASEVHGGRPGFQAVISRLIDILFIMVMRSWIDQHSPEEGGWLGALYDPHIGQALNAVHSQPDRSWSLQSLSQVAFLSRSAFSERFTGMVGLSPMKYVTRWRIQLATNLLSDNENLTVEQIAHLLGYASGFAFSKAFKRLTGVSPADYRSQLTQ